MSILSIRQYPVDPGRVVKVSQMKAAWVLHYRTTETGTRQGVSYTWESGLCLTVGKSDTLWSPGNGNCRVVY